MDFVLDETLFTIVVGDNIYRCTFDGDKEEKYMYSIYELDAEGDVIKLEKQNISIEAVVNFLGDELYNTAQAIG